MITENIQTCLNHDTKYSLCFTEKEMRFECVHKSCKSVLYSVKRMNKEWEYMEVIEKDVFVCPCCQDIMVYKPSKRDKEFNK